MNKKRYWDLYGYKVMEQISNSERIIKIKEPETNRVVYSHQFFDGKEWNPCSHCGDKIGIPSTTTKTVTKIEHIRKFCSAYRSSLKSKE